MADNAIDLELYEPPQHYVMSTDDEAAASRIESLIPPVLEAKLKHDAPIVVGSWTAGLGSSYVGTFLPNCCLSTLLPCVAVAQISQRLDHLSYKRALATSVLNAAVEVAFVGIVIASSDHDLLKDVIRWGLVAGWTLLCVFELTSLRTLTRQRFQIPGSTIQDSIIVMACCCCAISQMGVQAQTMKPGRLQLGSLGVLPAYPQTDIEAQISPASAQI